jgi:hypothetical protein
MLNQVQDDGAAAGAPYVIALEQTPGLKSMPSGLTITDTLSVWSQHVMAGFDDKNIWL